MQTYQFSLKGTMPLLMHADDVEAADMLEAWRKAPENKNLSKAGDDRSPSWTWQTYCYTDGDYIAMPSANIMVCLRQAGAQVIMKKQKTFKELTQSGMLIDAEFCTFLSAGKQVPVSFLKSIENKPFGDQAKAVEKHGIKLFAKRAKIGQSKHIRVRPRFNAWEVRGSVHVVAPELTESVVRQLFDLAGRVGICDWRPGCKTPGPFGMFTAEIAEQ